MAKRIVYCADGTWQNAVSNTNVYRLYKALIVDSDQVTYYDDGVGADASGLARILQGAFGQTILQKIKDGYTKIAHVYEPGDQLYFFGFSRGAYTVRSLAGMIAGCGIPTGSFTDDLVDQVFNAYRDPANRASMLSALTSYNLGAADVQMIGVWDTVGSLGIPAIFGQIDQKRFGFLDTTLHPDVKHACQCLAIDEERAQFPATLWTEAPGANQTIEQVWFSGCHADVGGGTVIGGVVDAGTRLCDITLGWMAAKAQANGLTFDPAAMQQFQTLPALYALDAIRQSYQPVDGKPCNRPIDAKASIANSAAVRVQYAVAYKPANLTYDSGDANSLADTYDIVDVVSDVTI